ncbi:MAG: carbohydrate-binding protein [Bacteroidetes bacterium]|nr:carbohydrate-binding protein [Bacteroidota bacterium]
MRSTVITLTMFLCLSAIYAQSVTVGAGSYGTVLPSGTVGPRLNSGAAAVPKTSPGFTKPPQTCDYWSNLIFPFYGDPHSNVMYAHPLNARAKGNGLQIGHTTTPVFAVQDYLYPFQLQLTVGVSGLSASKTMTDDYGDWTVRALWDDGTRSMRATLGHGLPFIFFTVAGGNAVITCNTAPTIWSNQRGVLGVTIEGRHYGIFAPDSSVWTGTTTLQSSLNGKNFLSVALLPDNMPATLELFRLHAYAFVTGSTVSWSYDAAQARVTSTFTYTTELKEAKNGNVDTTMTALYRHQWLNTDAPLTTKEYPSVAGKMKLFVGNSFTTTHPFTGVLPSLPDEGDYNRADLTAMVNAVATETLPATGTKAGSYWSGKAIGRFAQLVRIADQLGATAARDHFLSQIKLRLQEWLTAGGPQSYVYDAQWKTLTGYPSEYGADTQLNDHTFHSGYAIMGAAVVAQYDSAWASPAQWGGMVDLLIRDGNNYDRSDTRFPFLRAFDAYAGHSWAAGHGDFGDGNNQESSSEAMNFAAAVALWGEVTHQPQVRDAGIFLYATEQAAIDQYWFDVDNAVFPPTYQHTALGMVWGGKGVHSTWFGANADFVHGINMLPLTGASLYLGRDAAYVQTNYEEIVKELNGKAPTWKDIMWMYRAFADPASALGQYFADQNYTPEEGGSKPHTVHWLHTLKKLGRVEMSVRANIPFHAVFKSSAGTKSYAAYNAASDSVLVQFTDGYSMKVGPRSLRSVNTAAGDPLAPVALLIADKVRGKVPLTVGFSGSKSFDRNGSPLQFQWSFGASSADTTYTFTAPGTYMVVLTVRNGTDRTAKDSVSITVLGNGTPYSGTPVVVPALIQAEKYDNGGEGVAYHDNDAANVGLAFRPTEGVDIEGANDGGFDVYWMTAGEWLEYTIQVPVDGSYDIIPSAATVPGFGYFRIVIDNVDVSGKRPVLNTGGWQSWKNVAVTNVPLKAGKRILRLEVGTDTQSEQSNWLFSVNSIDVKASTVSVTRQDAVPAEYALEQNFPNPFNPSTVIRYHLPAAGMTELRIYDVLGKEIATLVNEVRPAGIHEVQFNALGLTSGIYFCRIRSGGFSAVKSMQLLK